MYNSTININVTSQSIHYTNPNSIPNPIPNPGHRPRPLTVAKPAWAPTQAPKTVAKPAWAPTQAANTVAKPAWAPTQATNRGKTGLNSGKAGLG